MKPKKTIFLLFLLTIISRAGFMILWGGFDNEIHDSMSDQYFYIDIGQNLADGKGFITSVDTFLADAGKLTSITPPLYPYFLAGVFSFFGKNLVVVRLIHILLSFVVVTITYWLGKQLFSESVGQISGMLVAIHPAYVMYVRPIMSEGIFFVLVSLMALTAYLITQHPKNTYYYLAFGFVSGLGFLARSEALVGMALLMAFFAFKQFRDRSLQWGQLALACAVFGALLVPITIYNYRVHGNISPFPNKRWLIWNYTWLDQMRDTPEWKGVNLPERYVIPDYSKKTELERDQYLSDLATTWIKANPVRFLYNRIKFFHHAYPVLPREELPPPYGSKGLNLKPDGYQYGPSSLDDVVMYLTPLEKQRGWIFRLLIALSIPAIFLLIKNRAEKTYFFLIILLWNVVSVFFFVGQERFRYQVEWVYVILSVYSVAHVVSAIKQYKIKRHISRGMAA
jgi:4-amino-4-deoxy-L-arabinose transferase-like glycosyltransferase